MWPSFGPTCSLGSNLGPSWVQHSATWRIVPTERGMLKTRATATAISLLFLLQCFIGGSYSCSWPHTGSTSVILTTTCAQTCRSCAILTPTCAQTCRSCAILGPQVGPKLAHARLNLRLSMVKFGPNRVRLGSRRPVFSPHPQLPYSSASKLRARPGQFPSPTSSKRLEYPHTFCIPLIYYPYTDCILLISSLQILLYFLH